MFYDDESPPISLTIAIDADKNAKPRMEDRFVALFSLQQASQTIKNDDVGCRYYF